VSVPAYPAYKHSGVEWLGEVPAHWDLRPIKYDLSATTGGSSIKGHSASEEAEGLYQGFSASGPDVWLEDFQFERDGIVLSAVGARCGKTFKASGRWGAVANTHCLFPRDAGVRDFWWYVTNREDWWEKGGTAQPFVKVSDTLARKWPVPPPAEQAAIAALLDRETGKIDALVEEQRRLIALLKEKRQAVISHAVTKGLNPHAALKPSGVEWLGDVPAHWDIIRLGAIYREAFRQGNDDLPVLSVSIHHGVSDYEMSDDEMDRKVVRSDDRSKYKQVQPNDLVYNMMRAWQGGFGTVKIVGQVSPAYVVAEPLKEIRTEFIEGLLRTPTAIEEMRRHSKGVADFRLRLYWDEFKDLKVAVPPLAEADEILRHCSLISAHCLSLEHAADRAITLLQERRAALIAAAVTGKIDVRGLVDAPAAAEAA
jgi:type I restriction enzyme S subunit